jgi:heme/copper-type cytochrome/quinol oxidase subunit 3
MSATPIVWRLTELPAGKVAMLWFLASEVTVFGGLMASYVVARLGGGGWPQASAHMSMATGAFNTLILLTSSLTMVLTLRAAEAEAERRLRLFFSLTILLGLTFLVVKFFEYSGKVSSGLLFTTAPFWAFYYVMTGLHALHVLAGIAANTALLLAFLKRPKERVHRTRIELAGLYWHFVDVVWIFLYPLLYLT